MKTQTAVEWLEDEFEKYSLIKPFREIGFNIILEQAKQKESDQQNDFAIGFAEWICEKADVPHIKGTMNSTLEIYKKEKGL
jgi:hypothetical protein